MPYLYFTNRETGETVDKKKASWQELYASHLRIGEEVHCEINRSGSPIYFTGTIKNFWYFEGLHVDVLGPGDNVITVRPGSKKLGGDKIVRIK